MAGILTGVWTFVVLSTFLSIAESQENGDLRLSDGSNEDGKASGRVEIYLNKVWGTLDVSTLDQGAMTRAGKTACRQLGYDSKAFAGTVTSLNINPANSSVPMLLENIQCKDDTPHILRCSYHNVSQKVPINHKNDFAVGCNIHDSSVHPYSSQVRLVQSETGYASSGYLEIFLGGSWGPVCNMIAPDVYAACRQMGYTKAESYHNGGLTYKGKGDAKADAFHCTLIDNYSCLKYCITTYHEAPLCPFGHDVLNCTYDFADPIYYASGSESLCSPSSVVALAVGLTMAMLLLVIIVASVIACCCCIPGCILFNTKKRMVEYVKI